MCFKAERGQTIRLISANDPKRSSENQFVSGTSVVTLITSVASIE
jgi:hypothetical protein